MGRTHEELLYIRNNTKFGHLSIAVPQVGSFFSAAMNQSLASRTTGHHRMGDWVEKGDKLFEFHLNLSGVFGKQVDIPINSPVSGRILDPGLSLNTNGNRKDVLFYRNQDPSSDAYLLGNPVIQVPEGTEITPNTTDVFGGFADMCWEHRKRIFPKFNSAASQYTESKVKEALDKMQGKKMLVFDIRKYDSWMKCHNEIEQGFGGLRMPGQ